MDKDKEESIVLEKLLNALPESIPKDLLWIPDDFDIPIHWSIDPLTGEYTGISKNDLFDGSTGLTSDFPSRLPGLSFGFGHNESDCENIIEEPEEEESEKSESTIELSNRNEPQVIDGLLKGIDNIKEVYNSGSLKSNIDGLSRKGTKTVHFARNDNINELPVDYDAVVPNPPSYQHPFPLDNFQKHAVYHIEKGESVFVAAHTSAGKTAVAEYAIGLCQKHLTKAIYTSPIKALSNQKFRDFRETFGEDEVGLLTGDVQINPDASSCLIMTTEILRSMLYRDSEVLADVEWVIFDEVHYVNDAERGVVWEQVIIMLPRHVHLVLLSATTPNTFEFADWVGRTRSEVVHVITTLYRPVPLEHNLYINKELFKIVDGARTWSEVGYKAASTKHQALKSKQPFIGGSVLVELVYYLKKRNLLPSVVFSFSRRKCEEYADCLAGVDLNDSSADHSQVHHFFSMAVSKLSPQDRDLPQLHRMEEMLKRGIAVHHSGLLPLMKETVEILFSRGSVKVLFATETFAMGVNMPTRTVVFSGLKKHDGSTFRLLHPGEYTQMAGRAGRRGKDSVGTVILLGGSEGGELLSALTLQGLLLGQPTKLSSQFRVTFGMILGLFRFETLQVEEMLKRSFSENASQKRRPEHEEQLQKLEKMIQDSPSVGCTICTDASLSPVLEQSVKIHTLNTVIYKKMLSEYYQKLGSKYFDTGRIIIVSGQHGGRPGVLLCAKNGTLTVLSVHGESTHTPLPVKLLCGLKSISPGSFIVERCSVEDVCYTSVDKLANVTAYPSERQLIDIKQRFAEYLNGSNRLDCELCIPEFKILEMDEARIKRAHLMDSAPQAFECKDFIKHYEAYYKRATLISRMAELQFASSDNSLALLPEYNARVMVLKQLGYVDEVSGSVQLKGRVACEIRTVENTVLLLVVELLFSGFFMTLSPPELASLLSTLYFQEKVDMNDEELFQGLPDTLVDAVYHLEDVIENLVQTQRNLGIQVTVEDASIKVGLCPVIYYWSLGQSFSKIALITDVLEGTIVRCVVRLEEGLRELCHAAKIMGDMEMATKFEEAAVSIKRDICFASSLYL